MKYQPSSITVTVLSGVSSHAALDKGVLTRLHFKEVHAFNALASALDHLRDNQQQLVLIDSALHDGTGTECLRRIAKDPGIASRALVMVTGERHERHVMDAIAAGCAGYVLRPYSLETLERHMRLAWESLNADDAARTRMKQAKNLAWTQQYDQAIDTYEEMVSDEDESLRFFTLGMEYLRKKKFGQAIQAFNRAVALNDLYAEAYQGLAYAHKGKGHTDAYQKHLSKAAEVFALQDKMQELKEIFVEILKSDANAVNPYNDMGVRLRREGDFLGALHAYNQALVLTPDDESVHFNIAKAHFLIGEKEQAVEHLIKAIELRPGFPEACDLLSNIQGGRCPRTGAANTAGQASPLQLD